MSKLTNDFDVIAMMSKEELYEVLSSFDDDRWLTPRINELGAVGVSDMPLLYLADGNKVTNRTIEKNGYRIPVPDIDLNEADNYDCVHDGTGIFLTVPVDNTAKVVPIRNIAYATITNRAGDTCPTMLRFEAAPNRKVHSPEKKAERLTEDFQLYSDSCYVLLRDGKISAVHSKEYVPLNVKELVDSLYKIISVDHPDFAFDRGMVSHEYLVCEFLLNDEIMEGAFKLRLQDAGMPMDDTTKFRAGVRFSTSDTGNSAVRAVCFYEINDVRFPLGGSVEMRHQGDASIENFELALGNLGEIFKDAEERFEALGNMEIQNIKKVILAIRDKYTMFKKDITEAVAEEYDLATVDTATGIDVYLAFNEIIRRQAVGATPTAYISLCETVEKMMKLPFEEIDKGAEVTKL